MTEPYIESEVVATVAEAYGLGVDTLTGPGRSTARATEARQVCIWILHRTLGRSLEETAEVVNRHRTTIIYHWKEVRGRYLTDFDFADRVDGLARPFEGRGDLRLIA